MQALTVETGFAPSHSAAEASMSAQTWRSPDCIINDSDELPGPGAQIPVAEILRLHRPGTRYAHPAKCHRTGAHRERPHLQRHEMNRQDDGRTHPGNVAELPLECQQQASG